MFRNFTTFMLLSSAAWADVPNVVTDIAPVHALVNEVMGDLGEPELLIPPGASPHHYSMRPSEARMLSQADVVVWMGPELARWLDEPVETLAASAKELRLSDVPGTSVLPARQGALFGDHDHSHGHGDHGDDDHADAHHDDHEDHHDEHEEAGAGKAKHDHDDHDDHAHEDEHAHDEHDHDEHAHDDHGDDEHAHEDEHKHADHKEHGHDDHAHEEDHAHDDHDDHDNEAGIDPHQWIDPQNATLWMTQIAVALGQADPENAGQYLTNAQAAGARLAEVDAQIKEQLAPYSENRFVVPHDGLQYFEARYGLQVLGAVSDTEDDTPGPARVAKLRETLQSSDVQCALVEPQSDERLLQTVIEGLSFKVVEIDLLGADTVGKPDAYIALLTQMADGVESCLSR